MQQLPLGISPSREPDFANFVAGSNREALARVMALAAQTLEERIVYLWGTRGSGRSHLLAAAARANPSLVIADDVHGLDERAQHALFMAINEAREGGPAVLAAGDAPPAQLGMRPDLASRLAWGSPSRRPAARSFAGPGPPSRPTAGWSRPRTASARWAASSCASQRTGW